MKSYTITPKGQVTIPVEVRQKLNVKPGDKIIYADTAAGIFIKPAKDDMILDFGFLKKKRKTSHLETIRKLVRKKIADRRH
jgi:AbrB family looped-hinge helix DNA binding protein